MKIRHIILLIFFFTAASCSNDLEQLPISFTSPENVYKTENDFKLALAGCYEVLNTTYVSGGNNVSDGTYASGLFYMMEGPSDVVLGINPAESMSFEKATYLPTNQNILKHWQAFYTGISRCNFLLDRINNSKIPEPLKIQISGEARFMRAFYYNHLATLFGGIPVLTSSKPETYAARAKLKDVYTLIISDFDFAYKNLGSTGIFGSSANKWTAGAYLGSVYNYLASCKRYMVGKSLLTDANQLNSFDWVNEDEASSKAVQVLQDVVNTSPYVLVSKSKYPLLFREASKLVQKEECLFMSEWSESLADNYLNIQNTFTPVGNSYLVRGSYGRFIPTTRLYYSYVAGDIRRDMFITGRFDIKTATQETVDGATYMKPNSSSFNSNLNWQVGKYRVTTLGFYPNHSRYDCSLNHPLMRMADVVLQLSEALYFTGNESKARLLFNDIRTRVLGNNTTLQDLNTGYFNSDFVTELLDERKRELCFESKRRIDLIRFDRTTEAISSLTPRPGESNIGSSLKVAVPDLQNNWQYYKIWLPIPQGEIDLNPNLSQNTGW
ncbi:MAG TPA: RagB/SusD family nutrient uptake outer membrane protein [Pelobium sp.]|nr:RagB/SusD family nutrient uptake outer membrane protein [Pelobium sp.]